MVPTEKIGVEVYTGRNTFQSLVNKGLKANHEFHKSVESLNPKTVTSSQVCDILKSQAELNRVNVAWNSITSMSVLFSQQRINALESTVEEQSGQINSLARLLKIHQLLIDRLCQGFLSLALKYEALSQDQKRSKLLLQIVSKQIALLKFKHISSANSVGSSLSRLLAFVTSSGIKFGLLFLLCDSLVRFSQLLNISKVLFGILLSRRHASRAQLFTRISSILLLVLLLKDKFSMTLILIRKLLSVQ